MIGIAGVAGAILVHRRLQVLAQPGIAVGVVAFALMRGDRCAPEKIRRQGARLFRGRGIHCDAALMAVAP